MMGRSITLGAGRAGHMKSDPCIYKGYGSALRGKSNGGKIGLRATPIWGMSVYSSNLSQTWLGINQYSAGESGLWCP
jgi:hypothetical protein